MKKAIFEDYKLKLDVGSSPVPELSSSLYRKLVNTLNYHELVQNPFAMKMKIRKCLSFQNYVFLVSFLPFFVKKIQSASSSELTTKYKFNIFCSCSQFHSI